MPTLAEWLEMDDVKMAKATIDLKAALFPRAMDNLKRLRRLELLDDEVIWSLLGQAPIDPLGLYGAMKGMGVWAFSPLDFTVLQVLAKRGGKPTAMMRLDLLSNDLTFVVLKTGLLVEHHVLTGEMFAAQLKEPGMTEAKVWKFLRDLMKDAIAAGTQG